MRNRWQSINKNTYGGAMKAIANGAGKFTKSEREYAKQMAEYFELQYWGNETPLQTRLVGNYRQYWIPRRNTWMFAQSTNGLNVALVDKNGMRI